MYGHGFGNQQACCGRSPARNAILAVAAPQGVQPQAVDKTTLKFSTPMMVPGATLPPGTCTFRLAETRGSRNVVQIWNEDETKLIASAMAIAARRQDAKGDVVLTIQRTDPKSPPALKSWFYPGALRGHEFVYSEKQAHVLADETKTLVLSTDAPEGSDLDSMVKGRLWHPRSSICPAGPVAHNMPPDNGAWTRRCRAATPTRRPS